MCTPLRIRFRFVLKVAALCALGTILHAHSLSQAQEAADLPIVGGYPDKPAPLTAADFDKVLLAQADAPMPGGGDVPFTEFDPADSGLQMDAAANSFNYSVGDPAPVFDTPVFAEPQSGVGEDRPGAFRNTQYRWYGFVRLDGIYDFKPIASTDSFVVSSIPVPQGEGENAVLTPRYTRLGFDTTTDLSFSDWDVNTRIEMDFFNGNTSGLFGSFPIQASLRLGRIRPASGRPGGLGVHGLRRVSQRPRLSRAERDDPHAAAHSSSQAAGAG